jgi:cysteinyl-tRNA synthetase
MMKTSLTVLLVSLALVGTACAGTQGGTATEQPRATVAGAAEPSAEPATQATTGARPTLRHTRLSSWVYQLQGYPHGRLRALARARHRLAVIDLARDAGRAYFTRREVARLRASGKRVLAYFEIGSIETFRPEYRPLRRHARGLILNRWTDWPDEYFVRYWDARWWRRVVRPRLDRALTTGFDGVYLDTPLAYEEIDLDLVPRRTRHRLARDMVNLIVRISRYAKDGQAGFWIVPQNSPELRRYRGYTAAIDGIGMEELFFRATDRPCHADWCRENRRHARALRDAGKLVLAVDYASRAANIRAACRRYRNQGFAGYVGPVALDRIRKPCRSGGRQ